MKVVAVALAFILLSGSAWAADVTIVPTIPGNLNPGNVPQIVGAVGGAITSTTPAVNDIGSVRTIQMFDAPGQAMQTKIENFLNLIR